MADALIGHTGFVGTTLKKQRAFDEHFRSSDIESMAGRNYSTVVCSGAPAQKWLANKEPDNDWAGIQRLIKVIDTIKCDHFILISTVDVFMQSMGRTESSEVNTEGLHAYGKHRHELEEAVRNRFERHLVVRLPGLVGPGLRKNIIYDLHNDNNLSQIDSRGTFQFYPMVNLWADIHIATKAGLNLIHLTTEPLSVEDVAQGCFGRTFHQPGQNPAPAYYDMQTQHAELWGKQGRHQYSRAEVVLAIRAYAQSEPSQNG